jgi:predicted DNA-binding protein (MmcQ/YjbR family)
MTHKELEDYILNFPDTWLDYPFGEGVAVYKVGHKDQGEGKMFALIDEKHKPLRISLKCDPILAQKLREDYETVLPGYHLNKKYWNTVLLTGQLHDDDIMGLITHSYYLVSGIKI